MPIYEYACEKCESEFEVEQRITEDPLKSCPTCRSRKVKRLISNTSFVLKGGGWYADLYSSSKKSDKADGGGEKPESGKSESKSDSKSADGAVDKSAKGSKEGKGGSKGKGAKAAA